MSHQVLARTWRPRDFASLVGQEHVVRALTHALDTDRLHHAYLFTGTRGVGKTTVSRILARALNCETSVTSTPCGACGACLAIEQGRFPDYVEMDAASNRGVDEMAQLLEQVVYAPVSGRYKVYMIDEVHMLSGHAFNAMLKTLEEPPAHVVFILATTDPKKVPVTVLSRCLQFNLKNLPPASISRHLATVLGAESVPFEQPALTQIGRAAAGSMRDALSLLEQAIAYGGGRVEETAVREMLGVVDRRDLDRILESLAAGDGRALVAVADDMLAGNAPFERTLLDLAALLQRIALAQVGVMPPDDAEDDAPARWAPRLSAEDLQVWYQIAIHGARDLPLAPDPHAGFSMTLLRLLAFRPEAIVPARPLTRPAAVPAAAAAAAAAAPAGAASGGGVRPNPAAEARAAALAAAAATRPGAVSRQPARAVAVAEIAAARPAAAGPAGARVPVPVPVPPAAGRDASPRDNGARGRAAAPDAAAHDMTALDADARDAEMRDAELRDAGMRDAGMRDAGLRGAGMQGAAARAAAAPAVTERPRDTPAPGSSATPAAIPPVGTAPRAAGDVAPAAPTAEARSAAARPAAAPEATPEAARPAATPEAARPAATPEAARPAARPAAAPGDAPDAPDTAGTAPGLPPLDFDGDWTALAAAVTARLGRPGLVGQFMQQSELLARDGDTFSLRVPVRPLAEPSLIGKVRDVLATHFGRTVRLVVEVGQVRGTTVAAVRTREQAQAQADAQATIEGDAFVQTLLTGFDGTILPESVQPLGPTGDSR